MEDQEQLRLQMEMEEEEAAAGGPPAETAPLRATPDQAPEPKAERTAYGLGLKDLLRVNAITGPAMGAKDAIDVIRGKGEATQKLRAFMQGITLGQAGKITGRPELYQAAARQFPAQNAVGTIALPTPAGKLGALKGAKGVAARMGASGATGALVGGLSAVGEGGDWKTGAAVGGGVGLVGGGVAEGGRVVTEKLGPAIAAAVQRQRDAVQKTASKALRSGIGKLGGESGGVIHQYEQLLRAAADPLLDAQEQAAAKAAAAELAPAARLAYLNHIESAAGRKATLEATREALGPLRQAASTDAVEAATQEALSKPGQPVLRFLKNYGSRVVPPLAGAYLGNELGDGGAASTLIGTGAGAAIGAVMGNPGTALRNLLNNPSVQKGALELVRKGAGGSAALGRAMPTTAAHLTASESARKLSPEEQELLRMWLARQGGGEGER